MPRKHPPKRLSDVSHLFLSGRVTAGPPKDQLIETVVWIAVISDGLNRAHLASGVGAAFVKLGMKCTLLEFGEGLPNVGYYFSCKPDDYLIPTTDSSRVVAGWADSTFRYEYSAEPRFVRLFERGFNTAGSVHVIVIAFDYPFGGTSEAFLSELIRCAARFSGSGNEEKRWPEGVIIFTDGDSADRRERFINSFRGMNPGGIIFLAGPSPADGQEREADQRVIIPAGLRRSWSRRIPPSEPFFADLCSSFLQFLSHRRKMVAEK